MNRRQMLLGGVGLGAAAVGGALLRPRDEGAPYDDYFRTLNAELKAHGPMHPCLVVDLDRLDHNIAQVCASVAKVPGRGLRLVEKSLPSAGLLDYVMKKAGTRRLMSFHQPFLSEDATAFPDADILLGKPMPARAAELFYRGHQGEFDPARQLQWLIDAPEHLADYLALARGLGTRQIGRAHV
jgi:D-serine deaminase-like pyridoxal phosphate-dependent protein